MPNVDIILLHYYDNKICNLVNNLLNKYFIRIVDRDS